MPRYFYPTAGFDTFREALESRTLDDLKEVMRALGIKRSALPKAHRIAAIENHFAGERLRETWNCMDALTQSAIAEAVHRSTLGEYEPQKFLAKYGALPKRYRSGYGFGEEKHPYTIFDVLFTYEFLPQDLIKRFKEFVPEPPDVSVKTYDSLPDTPPGISSWRYKNDNIQIPSLDIIETESAALHDLIAVLRLVDTGRVSVSTATGKATAASANALCAILRDGDFIPQGQVIKADDFMRAFAWPLLLQAANLAKPKGKKLALTTAGKKALTQPPQDTLKLIWGRWLTKGKLDELSRINEIKGQKSKGFGGLTAVAERRDTVDLCLSECPTGKWVYIDDFFDFFLAHDMYFDITLNPWKLYIGEPHYGNLGYGGCHSWSILQGRYIMALLWEYAGTLGIVDIAHTAPEGARTDFHELWGADSMTYLSRYDGLKFFRLTPLGAYCLDMEYAYTPPPITQRPIFQVLPNQDIVLRHPEALLASDALFLERIATKDGDHTWRIDSRRILDSLESGISAGEIEEFLDANSVSPVPDNVRTFIEDTIRRAVKVRYEGPAEIYYVEDEATALLIAHDAKGKSLCYHAGQHRLVVPAKKTAAFQRVLRQLGFCAQSATGG